MKNLEHTIEIDRLVLTGRPEPAEIEAAVLRALRDTGLADATGESKAGTRVAGEVTQAVQHAAKGRGV